jgi:DNA-binding GntR family transcriptional regulator
MLVRTDLQSGLIMTLSIVEISNRESDSSALPSSTLWVEAYRRIRDRILCGELPLGTPLSRRKLAAEFRMSLLPVSEALRKLELDGLVETQRRAGTRVRIPTIEEIGQHIVVRAALECEAAWQFCQQATAEERRELLARAERLDLLRANAANITVDKQLSYAIHSLHFEFHMRIAEGAHSDALRRLIEQNQILTFNWVYDVATGNEVLPPSFHSELAQALVSDSPEAAALVMRAHVWHGRDSLIRRFRSKYGAAGDSELSAGSRARWRQG